MVISVFLTGLDYYIFAGSGIVVREQKEGCACFSPSEVYFSEIKKDRVVVVAPTHKIMHRGDCVQVLG